MRSTLFFIPAEFAGQPVFGWGWILWLWLLAGALFALWQLSRPGSAKDLAGYLPIFALAAAIFAFVLPNLVEFGPRGEPLGVPIRGFGVMFMLATLAGIGLVAWRAQQVGFDPEIIYSLAFAMFIPGIIGARLFYVIQYWHEIRVSGPQGHDWSATLQAIFNVTKGGLVVYGSLLAAVPAGIWFCWRHRLPVLKIGDIVAPGMLVGLALGRVGCFLNGCCFGGVCLTADYAVSFPAGSPPYLQQLAAGWNSGVWLEQRGGEIVVAYVAPDGPAASHLRPGEKIVRINGAAAGSLAEAREKIASSTLGVEIETDEGRIERWRAPPPARSVPVHATQLYAAIDAALLALVLWLAYPFRRRDGEVFALLLVAHPVSRFVLEMIRSDEPGQFGTDLTISQWISLGLVAVAAVLWWYIESHPSAFRVQGSEAQQRPEPSP